MSLHSPANRLTPRAVARRRTWLVAAAALLAVIGLLTYMERSREQRNALIRADPERIMDDPRLAATALSLGRSVYVDHCQVCHGAHGEADPRLGVPDLTDADFLYGEGRVQEIEAIVLHGIRAGDSKGSNLTWMPAYAHEKPYRNEPIPPLRPGEIDDVVQFLLAAQGRPADVAAAQRGGEIFQSNVKGGCYDCHGRDGGGQNVIGAPNLIDSVTLYGDGSAASLYRSIASGRAGISPAFAHHLTPVQARAVAVYTASLAAAALRNKPHE